MKDAQPLFSRQMLQRCWNLLQPIRPLLLPTLCFVLLAQVLQVVAPFIFKCMIDAIPDALRTHDARPLTHLVALSTGISIALSVLMYFRNMHIFTTLLRLERVLPVTTHQKLMDLSLAYHEEHDSGNTVGKVQRGVDRFIDLMGNMLFEVVPVLLQTLATVIGMLVLNWRLGLLFALFVPPFLWITYWVNRRVHPMRVFRHEGYEWCSGRMAESLMNVHTVQSFGCGTQEVTAHAKRRVGIYDSELHEWKLICLTGIGRDSIITVGRTCVLIAALVALVHGHSSIGNLVLYLTWTDMTYNGLFRLTRMFDQAALWAESVARLTTLLATPSSVTDQPNAQPIGAIEGSVELRHVSFSYNSNGRNALHDVSLLVRPGTTIAFVGPSGCGKTTITKLLFGHYRPCAGTVAIDGHDLQEVTAESVRSSMALVPQEVDIFSRSIRENIAFARHDATDEEIERVARLAHAHSFIQQLPQGYETVVGERGMKLSGGQRQRIGIARALLRDPRILVFDEATSSLDSESEAQILESMREVSHGRTTLMIAHRLSTVQHADCIVVLRNGCIVETGTHQQLLQRDGTYARLWQLQSRSHAPSPPHQEATVTKPRRNGQETQRK